MYTCTRKQLAKRCLTLLWITPVRDALVQRSSGTLLLRGTLVGRSCRRHPPGKLAGRSCGAHLWGILVVHSCARHSCGTLLCDTLMWDSVVGHSRPTLLWGALVGHCCRNFCLRSALVGDALVGHSRLTVPLTTLSWNNVARPLLLWDTLTRHS